MHSKMLAMEEHKISLKPSRSLKAEKAIVKEALNIEKPAKKNPWEQKKDVV